MRVGTTLGAIGAGLIVYGSAAADTFVFAHALEVSGKITSTQTTFDTSIFVSSSQPTNLDIYVFDEKTGAPALGKDGKQKCNPCKHSVGLTGTTFDPATWDLPPAVSPVVIVNAPGSVTIEAGHQERGKAGAPKRSKLAGGTTAHGKVGETVNAVTKVQVGSGQNVHDVSVFLVNTTGWDAIASGKPVTAKGAKAVKAKLYLKDAKGAALKTSTGKAVCAPCEVTLGTGAKRFKRIRVESLILGASSDLARLGLIIVALDDPSSAVSVTTSVVTAPSAGGDVSVFSYAPEPLSASGKP